MNQSSEARRLQWQCRRGIKEVEVLLMPFFEAYYAELGPSDQQIFERLLACQDVDLFEWFTQRASPEDAELSRLVDAILQSVGA